MTSNSELTSAKLISEQILLHNYCSENTCSFMLKMAHKSLDIYYSYYMTQLSLVLFSFLCATLY